MKLNRYANQRARRSSATVERRALRRTAGRFNFFLRTRYSLQEFFFTNFKGKDSAIRKKLSPWYSLIPLGVVANFGKEMKKKTWRNFFSLSLHIFYSSPFFCERNESKIIPLRSMVPEIWIFKVSLAKKFYEIQTPVTPPFFKIFRNPWTSTFFFHSTRDPSKGAKIRDLSVFSWVRWRGSAHIWNTLS